MTVSVAAVDLGATSGRVMLGQVGPDLLRLRQVARFRNGPRRRSDGLHWNFTRLYNQIVKGLQHASQQDRSIVGVGIDSWAVDYGLIKDGSLMSEPFHYRDDRSARAADAVHAVVPFEEIYARNGLQFLPFNTVYQLVADANAGRLAGADGMLLIPDLVTYLLTGVRGSEITNASTTGLLRLDGAAWDWELIRDLDLPTELFSPLRGPGEVIGSLTPQMKAQTGISAPVIAVASHDTASAVAATPMLVPESAYISCGTWGLVGIEVNQPIITDAARRANFTNEGGVAGTTRFLRNVMGLWLLNESMRAWRQAGVRATLPELLDAAAHVSSPVPIFDVDDPVFSSPGNMPERIEKYCCDHDLPIPEGPVQMTRSIVESLAVAFAQTVRESAELSNCQVKVIHIVGGGSQNQILCQSIADHSGLPVVAGPVEATAIGNVLMQARSLGEIGGELGEGRQLVARAANLRRYSPTPAHRA